MKRILFGFILGFLSSAVLASADLISAPPPIKDAAIYHYLREIYENFHRLQVVTTNPDGVRNGKKGDMVLLQTGGSSYLEINSDSGNTWLGVILTNTP